MREKHSLVMYSVSDQHNEVHWKFSLNSPSRICYEFHHQYADPLMFEHPHLVPRFAYFRFLPLLLVWNIRIARNIPNPANIERIIPATILCSKKSKTAKKSVNPEYEKTMMGKNLLTFFAVWRVPITSFIRSVVVTMMYVPLLWFIDSNNDINVVKSCTIEEKKQFCTRE